MTDGIERIPTDIENLYWLARAEMERGNEAGARVGLGMYRRRVMEWLRGRVTSNAIQETGDATHSDRT